MSANGQQGPQGQTQIGTPRQDDQQLPESERAAAGLGPSKWRKLLPLLVLAAIGGLGYYVFGPSKEPAKIVTADPKPVVVAPPKPAPVTVKEPDEVITATIIFDPPKKALEDDRPVFPQTAVDYSNIYKAPKDR